MTNRLKIIQKNCDSSLREKDLLRYFDIQRSCIHDGPGLRTTLFFKGCPLACQWCHNPESQSPDPEVFIDINRCVDCELRRHCPVAEAQKEAGDRQILERRIEDLCPLGAVEFVGRTETVDRLLALCLEDQVFFGQEGGVTFCGGEPLWQWQTARALALRLRAKNIHVTLDTSGLASEKIICEVPDYVDLIMVDLKFISEKKHLSLTGVSNQSILKAIHYWNQNADDQLWISLLLIPGVHDQDELEKELSFLQSLPNPVKVRLIPYHDIGNPKYPKLRRCPVTFLDSVTELLEKVRNDLKRVGIEVLDDP